MVILRVFIIILIFCVNIYAQDTITVGKIHKEAKNLIGIDNNKAEKLFDEAFNISEKIDFKQGMANSAYGMGEINSIQEKYGKAVNYFLIARKYYVIQEDQKSIKRSLLALGSINTFLNDYEQAISYLSEANDIQINDMPLEYYSNYYLALAYISIGKKDSALKIINTGNLPQDNSLISMLYSLSAHVYYKAGDYKNAIFFAEKSISLDKSDLNLAMCYNNMAFSYLKMNDLDRASKFAMLSINAKSEMYKGDALRCLAFIYIAKDKLVLAEDALRKSLITNGNSDLEEISQAYDMISDKYEQRGELSKALELTKISKIVLKDKNEKTAVINREANLAKKVTNDFNTSEMLISVQRLKQRNIFAIVALVLFIGVSVYLIYLYMTFRNNINKNNGDMLDDINEYKITT